MFSVGVATTFAIITRLDRLMVATKNLVPIWICFTAFPSSWLTLQVGEQYHIHGIGLWGKYNGIEMGSRTNSLRP